VRQQHAFAERPSVNVTVHDVRVSECCVAYEYRWWSWSEVLPVIATWRDEIAPCWPSRCSSQRRRSRSGFRTDDTRRNDAVFSRQTSARRQLPQWRHIHHATAPSTMTGSRTMTSLSHHW